MARAFGAAFTVSAFAAFLGQLFAISLPLITPIITVPVGEIFTLAILGLAGDPYVIHYEGCRGCPARSLTHHWLRANRCHLPLYF